MFQYSKRNVVIVAVLAWFIFGNVLYGKANLDPDQSSISSRKTQTGNVLPASVITDAGIEMVLIPAGMFTMGCDMDECTDEGFSFDNVEPRYVIIPEPFYLGKYQVTQAQWEKVMGTNPSKFKGDPNRPVENISWNDAQEFINRLNVIEHTNKYRLPTDAEWEYAARAGSQKTRYFWGNDPSQMDKYASYSENPKGKTQPVGTKLPNPWNLYDIVGNVFEWVQDFHDSGLKHTATIIIDPQGPVRGIERVLRGGSFGKASIVIRFADNPDVPVIGSTLNIGFRLAASVGEVSAQTLEHRLKLKLPPPPPPPPVSDELLPTAEQIAPLLKVKLFKDQMTKILNVMPLITRYFLPQDEQIENFLKKYPVEEILTDSTITVLQRYYLSGNDIKEFNKTALLPQRIIDALPYIESSILRLMIPRIEMLAKSFTE